MTEEPAGERGQEIAVFAGEGVEISLPLDRDGETVWATSAQIEELFGVTQSVVSRHIKNIFKSGEVGQESISMQKLHRNESGPGRPSMIYSLDIILAVGYRVNSARAIVFRRWTSEVLRDYLIKGVALNEKRLDELGSVVRLMSRTNNEMMTGVADVLSNFMPGLQLLREYDDGLITVSEGVTPGWVLSYPDALEVIDRVRRDFPSDSLLGLDPHSKLQGTVAAVYAGFGGHEIYPTAELKAAHLLYLVIKDHPLSDGNKRVGVALFVTFLAKNGILTDDEGRPRFTNNSLAALALLVASSGADEMDLMVSLIARMLSTE